MRLALLPLLLLCSACNSDPTKGHLVGGTGTSESEKTNYPPSKLAEQTFVFTSPMGYESKHFATADESKIALRATQKLGPADEGQRYIAVPVASAKGNSTAAEVMVYDNRKQTLVGDSVYRLANTPASGQTLKLDAITAIFVTPNE
jgi:hypothetical protein